MMRIRRKWKRLAGMGGTSRIPEDNAKLQNTSVRHRSLPSPLVMSLAPESRLHGEDLSQERFADLDLTGSSFEACTFVDVRFAGTRFEASRFMRCRFVRCHFANVEFRDSHFVECDFTDDAGHTGAHFSLSRMEQARFERCDLSFVRFERCDLYCLRLTSCNLRGSALVRVEFSRSFSRKIVKWAGWMTDCNFEFANLNGLRLREGDLRESRFREAVLHQADLEDTDLRDADLTRASLDGARLARADVRGATIDGLNLQSLSSFEGLMITGSQQFPLLSAMGLDVHPD